jgi:hypothetical protein
MKHGALWGQKPSAARPSAETDGSRSPPGGPESQLAGSLLSESEDGGEGLVDPPLLVWADSAHQIAKPSGVDCADLLNENAGGRSEELDLWAE